MSDVLFAGLLAVVGILPAIAFARVLRHSRREPDTALAYTGAVVAIGLGIGLAFAVRAALGSSADLTGLVFIVAAAGLAAVYGELGRVRAAWAAQRAEEAGSA